MYGAAIEINGKDKIEYIFLVDGVNKASQFALKAPQSNNIYEPGTIPQAKAGLGSGLGPVRLVLNHLRSRFVSDNLTNLRAIPLENDILQVIRSNRKHALVLLTRQSPNFHEKRPFSVTLPGKIASILLVCELVTGAECCEGAGRLSTWENRLICYADLGTLARVSEE